MAPAQDGPEQKPNVFLQNNRTKNEKESNTRIIDGIVKDSADNPQTKAIVQLKNLKTSSIVNFVTQDDGRYVFRDLPMDINFELVAKHDEITTPVKKVSVFDTRKHVIVNFQLAASNSSAAGKP
ncbi:MAG TPA: carboxypeptidase-like regulatory domain-containing protein [Bryobacteraceae bacterium]|nr:carboxypeptidase-like regulatory domain-containing protein [Bryobacteraceae bacterium]